VRPHAVYQVTVGAGTRRYCYDGNGNLTTQTIASGSGAVRYDTSTWWVANLARRISQGSSAASGFWYGPGRERIRQLAQKSGSLTEDTRYVGGLYEKVSRNRGGGMSTEHVHYVRAGGQAIAVVKRESGALQTRYLHRDHLGSVVALTDTTGAVIERYSYDPWGKRRDPSSWVTPGVVLTPRQPK
jgi:YD repeat-containing protein